MFLRRLHEPPRSDFTVARALRFDDEVVVLIFIFHSGGLRLSYYSCQEGNASTAVKVGGANAQHPREHRKKVAFVTSQQ